MTLAHRAYYDPPEILSVIISVIIEMQTGYQSMKRFHLKEYSPVQIC